MNKSKAQSAHILPRPGTARVSACVDNRDRVWYSVRGSQSTAGDGATHGRLAEGYAADFVVVDVNPFDEGDESLLKTSVVETVVAGRSVYTAGE